MNEIQVIVNQQPGEIRFNYEDIKLTLQERLTGRYIAETITDPDTGEVVVKANHMCTPKRAAAVIKVLEKLGRNTVGDSARKRRASF